MGDYESKVKELCARIAPDLDNCINEDKRDAYTYLDLKVTVTPEGVGIKGYLDPSVIKSDSYVLTTAQTWASLFRCRYSYIEGKGYALARA
jgi:site-specific DNA recombinase